MDIDILNSFDLKQGGIFVILCGPPASGKSTLANKIVNEFDNFVRISPDEIREEVTGSKTDQTQNNVVFGKVYTRLTTYLTEGWNVVYDATNCRSIHRFKIMDIVGHACRKAICIMVTSSIVDCLKRNSEREYKVSEDVIEKMYLTLRHHPPTIIEGYDIIMKV